ncbi:hypothetical protein V8E53_001172 [Lactarius tabidus]
MTATATTSTQLKGKAKDDSRWWNSYALVEQQRGPVAWTSSAILFAHESESAVVGRAFPSSRQFLLHAPVVVSNTAISFEPPAILSVSPDETWLFAYFPSRQGPGLGCFWRAHRADGWDFVESMNFPRDGGIVSAAWLGHAREWVTDPDQKSSRLPPLGPPMLASLPTIVLITQSLRVQLCCVRSTTQEPKITTISCSLEKRDEARDLSPVTPNMDIPPGLESHRCTHATIGLAYNENAVLVATRSQVKAISPEGPNITLGLDDIPDLSAPFHNVHLAESADWESWVQASNIELCEVRLVFDGLRTCLSTSPLPPLRCDAHPLSSIVFCPGDPQYAVMAESSSGPVLPKMYLCLAHLAIGQHDGYALGMENPVLIDSTLPKSELVVFGLSRRMHPNAFVSEWSSTRLTSKAMSETLTFILPHRGSPRASAIVAGSLSVQGTASSKQKTFVKTPCGSVTILQLPSLEVHPDWSVEPLLMGWGEGSSVYPPHSVALSPNAVLFLLGHRSVSNFASVLVSAIRFKRTIADVSHQLSLSSTSVQEVENVLYNVLEALETQDDGLRDVWVQEFFGVLVEVYRLKGEREQKALAKEDFRIRWKAMFDLCSVIACHSAFEDCVDGDSIGLDNVWPLTVLSTWFMDFLEEMMRECVLLGDSREGLADEAIEKQTIPSTHPILSVLLFPDALAKLRLTVGDVKRFYEYLKNLETSGENGVMSKNALLDTVDGSGVHLEALDSLLAHISNKVKTSNATDLRQSLVACSPVPRLCPLLIGITQEISKSNAIDKSRLFIKVVDFVSEVGKFQPLARDDTNIDADTDIKIITMAGSTTVPTVSDIEVPETLLKKRKQNEKAREERLEKAASAKKAARAKRKVIFKRAETYVKEYLSKEKEEIRLKRAARTSGDFYVPAQPKVYFVIRIRGINEIAPKPRKILQLLRLLQINTGVFVRVTKATQQMLRLVEPYVTYGEPNLKTVRELIYKRGYGKINRQRIPLSTNSVIENTLGKYDVLSVEDLVHEIFTVGPNFKQVSNFLWPFKLSNPTGGWRTRKFKHYVEGGDFGNREANINKLVRQMN